MSKMLHFTLLHIFVLTPETSFTHVASVIAASAIMKYNFMVFKDLYS